MSIPSVSNASPDCELQHASTALENLSASITKDTIASAVRSDDSYCTMITSYLYSWWEYFTGVISSCFTSSENYFSSVETRSWDGVLIGSVSQTSALRRGSMHATLNIGKYSCTMIASHAVRMFLEDRMNTNSDVDLAVMKGMASTLIRLGFRNRLPCNVFTVDDPIALTDSLQNVVDELDGEDRSLIDSAIASYNQPGGARALQSFDEITGGGAFS